MITKWGIRILSFCMMVIGLTYILIYINLFTFGYTIKEYLEFILKRYECYLFVIGITLQIICFYHGKEKKK